MGLGLLFSCNLPRVPRGLPFRVEPNAPAHCERPNRALSDSAESPAGRDAVARRVRLVFAPRVVPHFLLSLALFLHVGFHAAPLFFPWNRSLCSCRFDLHSMPSFPTFVAGLRSCGCCRCGVLWPGFVFFLYAALQEFPVVSLSDSSLGTTPHFL